MEKGYARASLRKICANAGRRPDSYIIHWMAHMTVDAFIHLLTHEKEEQAAVRQMKVIMNFIVKGFVGMILPPVQMEGL